MIKRLNLLLLPSAFLFTTGAVFFPQQEQPAEAVYKNIQTLKGTPAKDILPAMQFMSASLKVDCEYCHVKGDFAADTKEEKGSARKMIEMQRNINKEFFNGKLSISCNSCHNGHTHPTSVPPLTGLVMRHKRVQTTEKPSDFFAKYAKASGPEPKSMVLTGTVTQDGKPSPLEMTISGEKFLLSEGEVKLGFDGSSGWHSAGGQTNVLSGSNAKLIQRLGRFRVSPATFATYTRQAVVGQETIGASNCWVVRGLADDGTSEEFYFDTTSGLLRRITTLVSTPLGRLASFVDLDNYQDVQGSKIPFKISSTNGEGETTLMEIKSGKQTSVDDKLFTAPTH